MAKVEICAILKDFFGLFSPPRFLIEKGKFLALDLGGTNFRVLLIHLKGDGEFEMQSKIYAIPQSIMIGSGTQLFDHIAECLANFIKVSRLNFNARVV